MMAMRTPDVTRPFIHTVCLKSIGGEQQDARTYKLIQFCQIFEKPPPAGFM